jgi:hypothetical protein
VLADEVRLLLAVLTCYRLAQLVTLDDGPMFVFRDLRKRLNAIASQGGKFQKSIAELFNCPYCVGVCFALLCTGLYLWQSVAADIILLIIGIAGGQVFLQSFSENEQ